MLCSCCLLTPLCVCVCVCVCVYAHAHDISFVLSAKGLQLISALETYVLLKLSFVMVVHHGGYASLCPSMQMAMKGL